MWQRFSQKARKVVFYAQEEARNFGHPGISTEHILLGLLRNPDSTAVKALAEVGLSYERVSAEVKSNLTTGDEVRGSDMTLTPGSKRVIDLAYDSARNLNNSFIGTEHLLLGLIRSESGIPFLVFKKLKVTLWRVEKAVKKVQAREGVKPAGELPARAEPATDASPRVQMISTYAREIAREIGEGDLSTEHLLLGTVRDPESTAARILARLGVSQEALQEEVERRTATYRGNLWGRKILPRVQRVLDLVKEEADAEGAKQVSTSHYLLALIREENGVAAKALAKLGVTEAGVREAREALRSEAEDQESKP